jgi:hypothetical protein
MDSDHKAITASDLRPGDFIVCCESWPNGRTILGVYPGCGGIDIMFQTCHDPEYHHETQIHPKAELRISRVFSDRFKNLA